ncbi:MAG: magnesium/cobalt transporter CorA [Candidatus Nanohaloarchaea archaeon]|nr:magnesium/cobalt transporter CorA [Candidatus Nanohaloarchaea archaeon]
MSHDEGFGDMFDRLAEKAGMSPGSLVHVGDREIEDPVITVIEYDQDSAERHDVDDVTSAFGFRDSDTVAWINIDGLHDVDLIGQIGEAYGLHPLLMEDLLNTETRPKVEEYDDHLFVVVKMLQHEDGSIKEEQVSLVLGDGFVLSFQETTGDVFDSVRNAIMQSRGRLRQRGSDFLAYRMLDAIIDNYFIILEQLSDRIEDLDDRLVEEPDQDMLAEIHGLKSDMVFLRRSVWPLREVVNSLYRSDSSLISEDTEPYMRDLYDHTVQVIETGETFRDKISGMQDLYLSTISNRMNEVMKVLTVIATIFIPLTFIAGIYGMNFDPAASPFNMPELGWYWGYPAVLLVMAGVAGVMLVYFRRRGWL